jgi:CxxC-x17-CxxC domain-containing protein
MHQALRFLAHDGLNGLRAGGTAEYWDDGSISSMEFQDQMLTCVDCGTDFVFTSGEQEFFRDKQFKNPPKRCKACKTKRVAILGAAPPSSAPNFPRMETRAVCSQCKKETTVPFRPSQGRPVFCRECFLERRGEAASA